MPTLITAAPGAFITLIQRSFGIALSLLLLLGGAQAQTSPTDGTTPLALSPGAPAGSYALSGFDNVNLYNGHLNFSLPLLSIGGRGGAQMTMTLPIESAWQIQEVPIPQPGGGFKIVYIAVPNLWEGIKPGYGPGVLQGRRAGWSETICPDNSTLFAETLTRLTFTAPDGTEYELRDQNSNGQPAHPACSVPVSRGQVFVTADGTAATFISDTIIQDALFSPGGDPLIYPSGHLMMRDGTRYRIDNGVVSWLRDRNGNKMTFAYDAFRRVTSITDSLNRNVTVCYAFTAECGNTSYDLITFHGSAGTQRAIRVWHANLGAVLRTTQPGDVGTLQTVSQLFPPSPTLGNGAQIFNPQVVSSVELPNGQTYQFRYNAYGELARVALPTGGAFEYDYTGGVVGDAASGMMSLGGHAQVYRRVVTRRVYPDGTTGSLAEMMTYSRPESLLGADLDYVVVDHYKPDGATRLKQERHYFHGEATDSFDLRPTDYSPWKHGRERQTEYLGADGATVLRRTINTWQQRPAATWFDPNSDGAPPNDPRLIETSTTLMETNQVAKQTFSYDQYNNQTDVYEYDFGAGAPGPLIRRTHTGYVTLNNGADYAANTNIHIRSLPLQQQVFDAGGTKRAETFFEYDNYNSEGFHAPLSDCQNISGHDVAFSTGYLMRGNVTKTSRALLDNNGGVTGWVNSHAQYDIAGNVVKAIDSNGNPTQFDFRDNFGSPDDPEVQSSENPENQAPGELGGQVSYVFPFKITNALGHKAYTKYDYYLGRAALSEDSNGVKSNIYFNDALDRPTRGVRAIGTSEASQIVFVYNNSDSPVNGHPARSITTISDKEVFGESNSGNGLKSVALYDGLGRTRRGAAYEGSTWIITDTQFDALGRVSQVSNPYRAADPGSASPPSGLWTTNDYDALSRVRTVTTPDTATVNTEYSGNRTLVIDQAGKQRISQTDALGRLTNVWEVRSPDAASGTVSVSFPNHPEITAGYRTDYLYDVLGNLRKVTQGAQTRWFAYDSLSRLIRVKNPEQNTNSSLPPYTDPVTGGSGWCMAYSYDANGNLVSKTDARNITTSYAYDGLNRNTTVSYSDATPGVTRTYDTATLGKGRFQKAETAGSMGSRVTTNAYDAMGRPLSQSQQFFYLGAWGRPTPRSKPTIWQGTSRL